MPRLVSGETTVPPPASCASCSRAPPQRVSRWRSSPRDRRTRRSVPVPGAGRMKIRAVHGRVHVVGSSIVNSYCSTSSATRVNRSTRRRFAGRAAVVHIPLEVGGLDHQRVAVPVAARIPQILAESGRQVRAPVERDDAGIVHHLHQDGDRTGRLDDLVVAVCSPARSSARPAARAAQSGTQILRPGREARAHNAGARLGPPLAPPAVISGSRPFGGSSMSDVRLSNQRSISQKWL